MIKICRKCKNEFNALCNHLVYCNDCAKKRNKEVRELGRIRSKKSYYKNNKKRYTELRDNEELKIKRKEYLQQYYQYNKEKYKEWMKKSFEKNKKKWYSRKNTLNLLKNKKDILLKKCKKCNSKLKLEIHHEIYPVKVKNIMLAIKKGRIYFLCNKCHGITKRKIK